MPINRNIDIRGIDWPICVLNCKKEVNQMETGDQMEILVTDINVMNNIVTLIEQLADHSIEKHRENKGYRLVVRKR